jgi:pimeloyl-ACP methyl ester carboxylesterase
MMTETIITFQSYDGYSLEGTFLKADKEKAAALFVHGITSSRDELGFHSDYATFLALNDISSLRFDLRYHGVHETDLKELTLSGIVNDIDAAFGALKKHISDNTADFFIIGTSFGGGLAAYWVDFNHKDKIRKVILNAPVLDYENDVLERNGLLAGDLLSSNAQQQLLKQKFVNSSDIHFGRGLINELRYINGIRAVKRLGDKVVIFHGREDEDVPLLMSKKYKSKKNKLVIIDGVGHGFGVEDDEDLDFSETKVIHGQIYAAALKLMNKCL